jgi:hypothetical protein
MQSIADRVWPEISETSEHQNAPIALPRFLWYLYLFCTERKLEPFSGFYEGYGVVDQTMTCFMLPLQITRLANFWGKFNISRSLSSCFSSHRYYVENMFT